MTEIILARIVQTCVACPSQWDAWDVDGNYWYLRYRSNIGTVERQPSEDYMTWSVKEANIRFKVIGIIQSGFIDIYTFCKLAGINIHPQATIISYKEKWNFL